MPVESASTRKELFDLLVSELNEFVVVLVDVGGRFSSWHPGVRQLFGYTPDEFLGQNIELLLPAAERLARSGHHELDQAAAKGRTSDTRWLETKNGRRILVEGVTITLRNPDGSLAGYGKILHDVTERKTAEDSLSALAGALDQSIVLVKKWDGVIEHWTAGCETLFGWTAHEAVGRVAHELLHTTFPGTLEQIQNQLLTTGTWSGELEHVRKDGTQVAVSTHCVLMMLGTSDGPASIIETHTDITSRLQVQRELELANRRLRSMALELERSNQELEEFARIASHDLSAPITSTRWLVDLLISRHSEGLDESGRKYLHQVSQGLMRMGDLIDAVLAHAQVGKSAIGSGAAISQTAMTIAIDNLRRHIELSGAAIQIDSLPDVRMNPQALAQLFQNLISNAIKYRKPDVPPAIRISAKRDGDEWLFSVSDNGMGIEPEWHERIFHPLQRRHGMEIAGSGIGLATCKKIVTRAGGRIWVESEPGNGATFFFTIRETNPE